VVSVSIDTISSKSNNKNIERCNLTGQILDLLSRGHQFESHKPQGHLRLTWSLTSRPVGLVEMHTSWPGHPR
jgi:hypothetical protein